MHFTVSRGVLRSMSPESITSAQIRAARAMLGLQQEQLAKKARITRKTLAGAENGDAQPFDSTRLKIKLALEKLGVEFLERDGARGIMLKALQPPAVTKESGPTGPGES
ncbi:helix-turn-helix domain-containing protein [Devosia sp. LjRoot3]|uniref:helix-turn-helix domain-containing protein n=1 Tax=Devosia sp. LjRoot3 TaxID=3342319 RepID=UPI003ED102B4